MKKVAIIIDCGATSVRTVAVDETGCIAGIASLPNHAVQDPFYQGGLIWDTDAIFEKVKTTCYKVMSGLSGQIPVAIAITSFGVDGAPVDQNGKLLYPVISWQCSRTEKVMDSISRYIDPDLLFRITGLQSYHINTINKLIWLNEYDKEFLKKPDFFLFMPSILIHRLCGVMITDISMAGTSMLTEIRNRSFSVEILEKLDLDPGIFPPLVEAGTKVGNLKPDIASELGLPAGLPLISAGHDTQFALFGSGAGRNQPVLSSGTWEILMARVPDIDFSRTEGITTEFDAVPGLYNPGIMWVASGVLEWLAGLIFSDLKNDPARYEKMIAAAGVVPAGCEGLRLGTLSGSETLTGLTHTMSAGHFYRAALEAFSFNCREGLKRLEKSCGFKASSLICVGGGSKNALWNQIRADVLGIPVMINDQPESTALGAAMFAFSGVGVFSSPEETSEAWRSPLISIMPGPFKDTYSELYHAYEETLATVKKS